MRSSGDPGRPHTQSGRQIRQHLTGRIADSRFVSPEYYTHSLWPEYNTGPSTCTTLEVFDTFDTHRRESVSFEPMAAGSHVPEENCRRKLINWLPGWECIVQFCAAVAQAVTMAEYKRRILKETQDLLKNPGWCLNDSYIVSIWSTHLTLVLSHGCKRHCSC